MVSEVFILLGFLDPVGGNFCLFWRELITSFWNEAYSLGSLFSTAAIISSISLKTLTPTFFAGFKPLTQSLYIKEKT